MENFLNELFKFGLPAILGYGSVAAISLVLKYRFHHRDGTPRVIPSDVKFYLLIGFVFVYQFIPVDFSNVILEGLKEALGIAIGVTGLNEVVKRI